MNKAIYYNQEDNIQSEITTLPSGKYAVVLRDLDYGEVLPITRIYSNFNDAVLYANEIIGKVTSQCQMYCNV